MSMKRTGFARKVYTPSPRAPLAPIPRHLAERIHTGPARLSVAVKPPEPARSKEYRCFVASLPCDWCKAVGRSQAAHPNTGKGMAQKTDDRLCFPLCADAPGVRGCHSQFDQGALLTKLQRHVYEPAAGRRTRDTINSQGLWPANLPQWPEDEE